MRSYQKMCGNIIGYLPFFWYLKKYSVLKYTQYGYQMKDLRIWRDFLFEEHEYNSLLNQKLGQNYQIK